MHGLNLLFPPRCPECSVLVAEQGTLCAECWQRVGFLGDPLCSRCGYPFPYDMGAQALCGECIRMEPQFSMARAVCRYDATSSRLVTGLKYADKTQLVGTYGAWMARAGAELLAQAEVIVPVPLHRWRLLTRRYNQSALLAYALGRQSGVPVLPDALVRTRYTTPQAGLTQEQRRKNVKGAFLANARKVEALRGKKVLLVDDVMTTGSTIHACTKALLKAGTGNVYVLTLARTVKGE